VISRLQKAFAIELPLHYLFQYPTIAELSECIDRVSQGGKILNLPPIKSVARTENLPLSFAQQGLWFLDQLEGGSSTYNVPAALELKGSLNPAALEQSLVATAVCMFMRDSNSSVQTNCGDEQDLLNLSLLRLEYQPS
jgi:hypothetical protein